MEDSLHPDVLLQQLRDASVTVTQVKLDAGSCSPDTLRIILDVLATRTKAEDSVQDFQIKEIPLEADIFNKLLETLELMKQVRSLALVAVGLSGNSLRKLCKILNQWRYLSSLTLAGNKKLGPRGIKILSDSFLSKKTQLTQLDLSDTSMGHFGAQSLVLPLSLQRLWLHGNNMGHDGIWKLSEQLQKIEHMHTLDLASNLILDDGCIEIAKHVSFWQHLKHLNLANNDIEDIGVEVLARELEGSNVRELNLSSNQVTDTGAAYLAERLLLMHNLQVLNVASNKIQDAGCISIARGLVFVDESEEDEATDEDTERRDGDMIEPSESYHSINSDRKLALVKSKVSTKLKILNLACNRIGDAGAGVFVELLDDIPSLQILELKENTISDARLRILEVLFKHRQHDQQRADNIISRERLSNVESTTPKNESQERSVLAGVSFDLSEAEEVEDKKQESLTSETELLKKALKQMENEHDSAINLSQEVFNQLTGNFSPKRIWTYSAIGNLYRVSDDGLGEMNILVRSLYMHTAGALNEVRAAVVGELKYIHHENILQATAQWLGPSLYCFLYNLKDYKSLQELLENENDRKVLSWKKRIKVLLDLAKALEYCHVGGGTHSHRKPSFHGDVHPSNVFISVDSTTAKLSGCGLSRLIATDRGRFLSGDTVFGSRGYRCPRYERGSCQYDAASDMFSYGIVASEVLTGCLQGTKRNHAGMMNDVLFDVLFGEKHFEADTLAGSLVPKQSLEAIGQVAASCLNPLVTARPSSTAVVHFFTSLPLAPEH